MGRDRVIKKIKSSSIALIVMGGIFCSFFSISTFVLFVGDESKAGYIFAGYFFAGLALLMLPVIIIGISRCVNPMKARCLKKNPKLLEQADELFSDIIYQDKFIIYSNRIIANAKDLTQMAAFDEIERISENSSSYNGISTDHSIVLILPTYQIRISVYAKGKRTINELKLNIIQRCPRIMANYTMYRDRID